MKQTTVSITDHLLNTDNLLGIGFVNEEEKMLFLIRGKSKRATGPGVIKCSLLIMIWQIEHSKKETIITDSKQEDKKNIAIRFQITIIQRYVRELDTSCG